MPRIVTCAVTPSDLARFAGTAKAPLMIDVRVEQTFKTANDMIAGAIRRLPDDVEQWQGDLSERRPVVVYCVHGHEVSQGAALALEGKGIEASYLVGGIAAWVEQKLPVRRKREGRKINLRHGSPVSGQRSTASPAPG